MIAWKYVVAFWKIAEGVTRDLNSINIELCHLTDNKQEVL